VQSLRIGETTVDLTTGAVDGPAGPAVLSPRERSVLSLLSAAAGALVPREALVAGTNSRAADMAVSRLRRQLGPDGARIETVRGRGFRLAGPEPSEGLDLGWGCLHLPTLRVDLPDGAVPLTGLQAALLRRLAETPGRPVSREQLGRALWGPGPQTARVDLLLHRLRQRLEADPAHPRFVVTIAGRGVALLDARPLALAGLAPLEAVELVGRQGEIDRALDRLGRSPRRLLVHGPPGIGKSSLALAVAGRWAEAGRAAAVVDLQGAEELEAELRLAAALRMEAAADDDVVARSFATRGEFLLVLDGPLPPTWTERIQRWQQLAGRLSVLVAARAAPVGWPLLDLGGLPSPDARTLLERAAGRPLGDQVNRLVHRLEGNPLALELVGRALTRLDGAELDRQLALPLTPLRQAWRAALDQLPAAAHEAALALSQFRGPFTFDDAEAVVGSASAAEDVECLVAGSIVQPRPRQRWLLPATARELLAGELHRWPARAGARERFTRRGRVVIARIAASIALQGRIPLDELDARWRDVELCLTVEGGEAAATASAWALLAREAGERLPRGRRESWAQDLLAASADPDLAADVRAACLRAVHSLRWDLQARDERIELLRGALALAADPVLAAGLAAELASVVAFSFGAAEADALLAEHPMPDSAPLDERVRHLRHAGRLALFADQPQTGLPRLRRAVYLAEEGGLPLLEARCRIALGQALSRSVRSQEAEHHLRRAIALSAEHGLPEQAVRAAVRLSQELLLRGLRTEASTLLHDALQAARRAGLVRLEEQCVSTLGFVLVGQDRAADALPLLDRALELAEGHGARRALYVALVNRGLARSFAGDPRGGRDDLARGLDLSRRPGWFRCVGLAYRAVAEMLDGAALEAQATASEARELLSSQANPDAPAMDEAMQALAAVAAGGRAAADLGADGGAEVQAVLQGLAKATR